MAEMIVNTPESTYIVEDYDFIFHSGMTLPVTVNERGGDSIQFSDTAVLIHLASTPSMNDPKVTLPARDVTIYRTHLAFYEHRSREVIELAPEQQHEWQKTLKEISKTVQ